jgi:hypothetical protein
LKPGDLHTMSICGIRLARLQGDPVEIGVEKDGNADTCCLCNQGGSLLCCDHCPASYHMRCIGEQAKSLPEGEWACPECAIGGRGGPTSPLSLHQY